MRQFYAKVVYCKLAFTNFENHIVFSFLGNNYYCWITNPVAMVIFFVVPVVVMLLFNIIALVRVLVAVRGVRKVSNSSFKDSSNLCIVECNKSNES